MPPSPVMAQWLAAKDSQPDALLFFRMGDFYELFFGDAEAAAGALGIALTTRGEYEGKPIPMCGVPIHAAEGYLARLIRRGFRVAVAEQMEPARNRTGKAPLRREVVRLVTPGTLTEEALLDGRGLTCCSPWRGRAASLARPWLDISTGLFETAVADDLPALLGRLDPAEIIAPTDLPLGDYEPRRAPDMAAPPPLAARARVAEAFGASTIDGFGAFTDAEAMAAATALIYVRSTQAGQLPTLSPPARHEQAGTLAMDAATRASLEITRARDGGTEHTLFAAVQRTLTQAGARTLAAWLSRAADGAGGHRRAAGCLDSASGGPGGCGGAAQRPPRCAGRGPRAWPPVARAGRAAGSACDPAHPCRCDGYCGDSAGFAAAGPAARGPCRGPSAAGTPAGGAGGDAAGAAGRRQCHRRGV